VTFNIAAIVILSELSSNWWGEVEIEVKGRRCESKSSQSTEKMALFTLVDFYIVACHEKAVWPQGYNSYEEHVERSALDFINREGKIIFSMRCYETPSPQLSIM
jgi:hypothetical protein